MEQALPARTRTHNRVIPNGVDVDRFRPMDRDLARRSLGWDQDERVVLFVGNPEELRKRYELAAAAVADVRGTLGDVRLVVAHGIDPDRIPVYMNAADCLVLLSWMEGSPNVVKEALMCNLPVVATAVGDVPELLQGISPSFLVEPTRASVGRGLIACLRSPQRSNGRARSTSLSSGAIALEIRALYAQVARGAASEYDSR
jgi:glycosyltransferase involved in cell wall biosynthesis